MTRAPKRVREILGALGDAWVWDGFTGGHHLRFRHRASGAALFAASTCSGHPRRDLQNTLAMARRLERQTTPDGVRACKR
jgi:hypothetical protein